VIRYAATSHTALQPGRQIVILLLLPPITRQIEEDVSDFFSIPMAILVSLINQMFNYFDQTDDDDWGDFD